MDKLFTNKSIINKILIAIIIIMLFNFAMPMKVEAGLLEAAGGTVATAVRDFVAFLGDTVMSMIEYCFTGTFSFVVKSDSGEVKAGSTEWADGTKIDLPYISLSPEEIFSNKIPALNINFIQSVDDTMKGAKVVAANTESSLTALRNIISKWYVSIRTLALVGLLSVLVYTGIRIILSSTAQDKAKYKERLMDWLVAVCLLFFLHYIMLIAINLTNKITDMLAPATSVITLRNGDQIQTNGIASIDDINNMLARFRS